MSALASSPAPTDDDFRAARDELARAIVGGLVLLGYFGLVEATVGWSALFGQLAGAGPLPLLLAVGGLGGSYALRALRLEQLLAPVGAAAATGAAAAAATAAEPAPGFLCLLRCLLLNNAANWLLPARAGDLGLPLLLNREAGLPRSRGLGVLLWLRLLDLQALAGIGGLAFALGAEGVARLGGLAALAGSAVAPALIRRLAPWLARRVPRLEAALALLDRAPAAFARDIALTWLAWGLKLVALGGALALLGDIGLGAGLAGAIGGDLSTVLPVHAPLGAGSFETGVLLGLAPFGHPAAGLLGAAVQLHLLMLAVALAATGASLLIPSRLSSQEHS
ncbi:lysylphosphatidylglycerol synthase domain-containing protein [Derxia lacustris]|uniref:lysylphosphatidylglycerol synthase domain-containing protein n=1 Tax=Derxia lacustris TaxID=764842 RepID=UPI001593A170|nr:lysylphosphatidylglycerol synthase domain-containing protein [Derxia lacustris]